MDAREEAEEVATYMNMTFAEDTDPVGVEDSVSPNPTAPAKLDGEHDFLLMEPHTESVERLLNLAKGLAVTSEAAPASGGADRRSPDSYASLKSADIEELLSFDGV